jgi:hypothetical protein
MSKLECLAVFDLDNVTGGSSGLFPSTPWPPGSPGPTRPTPWDPSTPPGWPKPGPSLPSPSPVPTPFPKFPH